MFVELHPTCASTQRLKLSRFIALLDNRKDRGGGVFHSCLKHAVVFQRTVHAPGSQAGCRAVGWWCSLAVLPDNDFCGMHYVPCSPMLVSLQLSLAAAFHTPKMAGRQQQEFVAVPNRLPCTQPTKPPYSGQVTLLLVLCDLCSLPARNRLSATSLRFHATGDGGQRRRGVDQHDRYN